MDDMKLIALTFDDGPSKGITDEILSILEENGAVASFFLIGQQINEDTEYLMKKAHAMGCSLENHSFTHEDLRDLSPEAIREQIDMTSRRIEAAVGEAPKFFRPPYLLFNDKMFDNIPLTFISGFPIDDWVPEVTAQMREQRLMETVCPGYITLLHDFPDNYSTAEALRAVLPKLKEQGYSFVTIRDLFTKTGTEPKSRVVYRTLNTFMEQE